MRVRFTPQAARQYLDGLRTIRTKNPTGAATVQHRAEAVVNLLREHPTRVKPSRSSRNTPAVSFAFASSRGTTTTRWAHGA